MPVKHFGDKHFSSEFNTVRKSLLDIIDGLNEVPEMIESDFKGIISPSDPEPTEDGTYKPSVSSADPGTNYPNAGNLKAKEGFSTLFYKKGSVWTKSETELPGVTAETVFDEANNADPSTMKAAYDYSPQFFDKAITDKAGDGTTSDFGYDTNFTSTVNAEGIFANSIELTKSQGNIIEISINLPVGNPKGFVVLKKTGNIYETTDYFEVPGLSTGVNTINPNRSIGKDCLLGVVYNGSPNGFTDGATGKTCIKFLDYDMATVGNTSEADATFTAYIPFTYKVKYDQMTGDEAIELLKDYRASKMEIKDYYLEDFGGKILDPSNPDAGRDCTSAIQNCINAIMADNTINGGRIVLRGMYRIGGPLKQIAGSTWTQVDIPVITFSETDMKIKTLSIIGNVTPIWEEQGIINIPPQFGGCGFYSSIFNQTATGRANSVIAVRPGNGADPVFGPFNNVNFHVDNLTVIVRTHDNSGNVVQNTMGGINVRNNSNFTFGFLNIHTSKPLHSSVAPHAETYGLLLPKWDNHATVDGNYLRCIGFGVGLWATEHLQLNKYVGAGNLVGLKVEYTYPVTINTIVLEMNKLPVVMKANSFLQAFVYQTERVLDSSKWYYNDTGLDFNYESGHQNPALNNAPAQACLTTYIVHNEGGQAIKGAWHSNIRMQIIADEFGQSYLPLPVWSTLPTTQLVEGLEGIYNNEKYIRIGGNWKKVTLTTI